MQELINITIDHYYIERALARGGMSEVYVARDTWNNQLVAMKTVRRTAGEYYERFRREARAMSTLRHEHILPALDYGEYQEWAYMISPYIEYGTLTKRLLEKPLTLEEASRFLTQIASALQFAHDHGILHRDIKSSNVLLRDGTYAYLTDFGLVKSTQDDFSLTRSGFLIGTPEYMAPELVEQEATPQSDVYALGVLLYQMVTGVVPFRGANPVAIVMKHLREIPPAPSAYKAMLPPDAERVILQTLDKDPGRRFRSPRALATAFKQALAIETPPQIQLPQRPVTVNVVPESSMMGMRDPGRLLPAMTPQTWIFVGVIALLAVLALCALAATMGK